MDKEMIKAMYALLESGRIAMGASLTTMQPRKGLALPHDASDLLPRLKDAIAALDSGVLPDTDELAYVILEMSRITMGASLASRHSSLVHGPGKELPRMAAKVLPKLAESIRFYDQG